MLPSHGKFASIPLLEQQHLSPSRNADRWSSMLGVIFGVFLHLSLLGVNFVYWFTYESVEPETELTLGIAWTTMWAFTISGLAILFLWSLSKLVSTLCPEASHEVLYNIESRFVIGCLCSLLVMEGVYTMSQLFTGGRNGDFFLFFGLVCGIGIGATVHIKSIMRQHSNADMNDMMSML